jgi:hypothetical protein
VNKLKHKNTLLNLFLFFVLAGSFLIGKFRPDVDINPYLKELFPNAVDFEYDGEIYSVYSGEKILLGWIGTGSSSGYGGPLRVITGIDTSGTVVGSIVVNHKETSIFFKMAKPNEFLKSVTGEQFGDINYDYESIVGVTGATRSSEAIVNSVRIAVSELAEEKFDTSLPVQHALFEFGFREIAIISLFLFGFFARRAGKSLQEWLRWIAQIAGLLIIGFWEDSPITLTKITVFLSGYFPDIHTGLYWYLILFGFVLTIIITGKSVYCTHICPFGALQRCIGVIGGAKLRLPLWSVRMMVIIRNTIVVGAVSAALITVQPGSISYEPFATAFALKGTLLQWFLLMVVLVASLAVKNPWCHFLCPMRPCEKILQNVRQKTIQMLNR